MTPPLGDVKCRSDRSGKAYLIPAMEDPNTTEPQANPLACPECNVEAGHLAGCSRLLPQSDNILNPQDIPATIESDGNPKASTETEEVQEPGQVGSTGESVTGSEGVLPQTQAVQGEVVESIIQVQKSVDNRQPDGKFGPGNIANPNGRPKREWTWQSLIEEYADRKRKVKNKKGEEKEYIYRELVVKRLYEEAANGNIHALREIMNRMDGMPNQPIGNPIGKNGQPQAFIVRNTNYSTAVDEPQVVGAIPDGGNAGDNNTV
jgi:hypothetical protein